MRGCLIIAPKVVFSIGIFLKIEDYRKGHYIFWQMIMELLIFMRISIIEKFLDVVSYLSVVMYVNFACTHKHTHTHSESLVLNLGVFIIIPVSFPPSFGSVSVIILKAVAV